MTTALETLDARCLALASIGAARPPSAGELDDLRKALGAEASPLRTTAARALGALLARGALGEQPADAISRELAEIAARDPHLWTRHAAAAALSHATGAALAALETTLRGDDAGARERAARAIGHWGRGDPDAIVGQPPAPRARLAELALAAALGDEHHGVRSAAAEALGALPGLGPSVGALAALARGPAPVGLRVAALGALGDAGALDHDAAFEALEATLTGPSRVAPAPVEGAPAAHEVPPAGKGAPAAHEAPPADESEQLLVAALEALAAVRRPDRAARLLAPLLGLLRSYVGPEGVRIAALRALASFGAEAAPALDEVLVAAGHRTWALREQAVETFGEIAAGDPSLAEARLPALVSSASSGERYIGLRVLFRLGALPEGLAPAVWAVALDDHDARTRELAREVLGKGLGPAGALPARLGESLGSARPAVRARAADLARRLGPAASPLVPALVGALPDPSRKVRRSAVEALGAIGAAALPGVPPALRRVFEGEGSVAQAARASLKALAPKLGPDLRARVTAAVERGTGEVLLLELLDRGLPADAEAEFLRAAHARARWHGSICPDPPDGAPAAAPAPPDGEPAASEAPAAPAARRAALAALAAADEAAGRRKRPDTGPGARQREAAWLLAFAVRGLMNEGG
ncbi:MAG TPA: HEAT repeat domain-containing protein [Polyangiaceae bacterium]|nr:HEAT repeat domain-containing protein [Polyangiaceae bacterium]